MFRAAMCSGAAHEGTHRDHSRTPPDGSSRRKGRKPRALLAGFKLSASLSFWDHSYRINALNTRVRPQT